MRPNPRLLVLVAALACAHSEYTYVPTVVSGPSAPPGGGTADVQVSSFGIVAVRPLVGGGEVPGLHLRVVVSTQAAPLRIDVRAVTAGPPGFPALRPTYANSDVQSLPIVQLTPPAAVTLDLFVPLPDGMVAQRHLPAFEVRLPIERPDGTEMVERRFERVGVVSRPSPTPTVRAAPLGRAAYWWYEPLPGRALGALPPPLEVRVAEDSTWH